jgi:hypothetical protein
MRHNVADPDPGSGAFLTPGSGIRDGKEKNPDPDQRSHINIPDHLSESLETVFRAKNTEIL